MFRGEAAARQPDAGGDAPRGPDTSQEQSGTAPQAPGSPESPSTPWEPEASQRASKSPVFRSVKLLALITACTLVAALVAFGAITWRGFRHFEPIQHHIEYLTRLQQAGLRLEELTIPDSEQSGLDFNEIATLRREIGQIAASGGNLSPKTPARLSAVETALSHLGNEPRDMLRAAVDEIRQVLAAEVLAHGRLLSKVRHDLILEFTLIGTAIIGLCGLGLLTLVRMRRRVFGPLNTLETLLALLAKRDYSLAPTKGVDPLVQPLTASYNHLVNRLVDLEAENARHRNTLEQEVRTATETLLEQQRNLAAAERLAAAGEIAARIAHELRNPLAGMQMALTNIRAECSDREDVGERLELVIHELRRITALLNGVLDQSRITPEHAVDLRLATTVEELLSILRYQVPREIRLEEDIPEDLVCHLPEDRLRQVLLNLILNSAEAIGGHEGAVTVHAASAGGQLELTVNDDGPGFPEDLLREGIGTFRSCRPGGTGLGLSIVSRLVRNLDGRIDFRNLEPHGASVRLTLPCGGSHA